MRRIVHNAIDDLLRVETEEGLRRNRRRVRDQLVFNDTLEAILCELIHHHLVGNEGDIFISRSNRVLATRSRYRPAAYSKMFPYIVDLLQRLKVALLEEEKAEAIAGASRSSVIRPGKRLVELISEQELSLDDLQEEFSGEIIVLKRAKDPEDYRDEGGLVEYDDDGTTIGLREQLSEINSWISAAELSFDHTSVPWPHTDVDISNRRLRRVFTQGRFDSGGRLFGGFWQAQRKHERCMGLSIDREPAVELDYGQVGPRILYGMAGLQPPAGDLYDIPGYQQQRAGIKRVMSAMIFAGKRLNKFPRGTKALFRSADKIGEVVEAIEQRHPLLKGMFFRGLGHEAQFIESEIMIKVLMTLKDRNVVALPIHDAIMIPASAETHATEIMLSVFHEKAGTEGLVTKEL
jgi:hypothetical protein